ncbi:secreted protein, partial [marine sediment metagenome]
VMIIAATIIMVVIVTTVIAVVIQIIAVWDTVIEKVVFNMHHLLSDISSL